MLPCTPDRSLTAGSQDPPAEKSGNATGVRMAHHDVAGGADLNVRVLTLPTLRVVAARLLATPSSQSPDGVTTLTNVVDDAHRCAGTTGRGCRVPSRLTHPGDTQRHGDTGAGVLCSSGDSTGVACHLCFGGSTVLPGPLALPPAAIEMPPESAHVDIDREAGAAALTDRQTLVTAAVRAAQPTVRTAWLTG